MENHRNDEHNNTIRDKTVEKGQTIEYIQRSYLINILLNNESVNQKHAKTGLCYRTPNTKGINFILNILSANERPYNHEYQADDKTEST